MNIKEIKINAQLLCNKSIEKENFFKYINEGINEIENKKINNHFIFKQRKKYLNKSSKYNKINTFYKEITSMHQTLRLDKKYHETLIIYIAIKERKKYHGKRDNLTKKLKKMYKNSLKK